MSGKQNRRAFRFLERATLFFERGVNFFTTHEFNPFYHTGTLTVWLLALVGLSGLLLLVIYFTIIGFSSDVAFASLERLNEFPLGQFARSAHRYAADLALVFVVLHALRMFVTDRFSGARWLAWVAGVAALALVLFVGVLGFWLVGDLRGQMLSINISRLLGAAASLAFLTNADAQKAFFLFYAVLALHITGGLFVAILYWVHTLRLSRALVLPARFWTYATLAVLILVAIFLPARLAAPADYRFVKETPLDPFFLWFIPALASFGVPTVIVATLAAGAFIALLPWLLPRRDAKPIISAADCTGCTICAVDCPYDAIEMCPRSDDRPYKAVAVLNPSRCVSCGICVGSCSWDAIRQGDFTPGNLRAQIQKQPRVIFACERHTALGAINPRQTSVVTVPCAGSVHPDLILSAQKAGAEQILVVGCLDSDCAHREGAKWITERFSGMRRPPLSREVDKRRVRVVFIAPDDARRFRAVETAPTHGKVALRRLAERSADEGWFGNGVPRWFGFAHHRLQSPRFIPGLALLAAIFLAVVGFADVPYRPYPAEMAQLKIALAHGGKFRESVDRLSPEQLAKLPSGVTPEQVVGAPRFPVHVEIDLDGAPRLRRTYAPTGLRQDGLSFALEEILLTPGEHRIVIRLDDTGAGNPQKVFDGAVTVQAGEVRVLGFDSRERVFVVR